MKQKPPDGQQLRTNMDTSHTSAGGLLFDEASHTYTLAGRRVPSVTQVLADLIPGWQASEWYLDRGKAVHACAAMIAQGVPFEHDPIISGQVAACRRFVREVCPVFHAVERRVCSRRYQYAGTMDALIAIKGTRGPVVLDWKASIAKSLPCQLAAYAAAYTEETGVKVRYGVGVELRPDGTYRMTTVYDLRLVSQKWLAFLTVYGARRECGQEAGEAGGMQ